MLFVIRKLSSRPSKLFQYTEINSTTKVPVDYDVVVPDINEKELDALSRQEKIEHLSVSKFRSLPVNGVIHGVNRRLMVPLPCRELWRPTNPDFKRNPQGPVINVWFLIDTASTHSYITERTMTAIFGDRFDWVALSIQRQEHIVECFNSRENFKEINILGMAALREMNATIEKINWNRGTFTLGKTPQN